MDSVRFSGRLQTATSRYICQVEQKNQCSLSASLGWALQECQCFASFYDGPPRSTERQVFRDIWWVHQTRSLSDAVTKTLVLGILFLGHVSAHAVHAAATILSTFVLFVVCVLAWTAFETFFSWPSAIHRMKFQRNVFGSLDVVHREDGHVCHQWANGARQVFGISKRAPFCCSSLHLGDCKPNGRERTSTGSCLQVQTTVGCGRFLTH